MSVERASADSGSAGNGMLHYGMLHSLREVTTNCKTLSYMCSHLRISWVRIITGVAALCEKPALVVSGYQIACNSADGQQGPALSCENNLAIAFCGRLAPWVLYLEHAISDGPPHTMPDGRPHRSRWS